MIFLKAKCISIRTKRRISTEILVSDIILKTYLYHNDYYFYVVVTTEKIKMAHSFTLHYNYGDLHLFFNDWELIEVEKGENTDMLPPNIIRQENNLLGILKRKTRHNKIKNILN